MILICTLEKKTSYLSVSDYLLYKDEHWLEGTPVNLCPDTQKLESPLVSSMTLNSGRTNKAALRERSFSFICSIYRSSSFSSFTMQPWLDWVSAAVCTDLFFSVQHGPPQNTCNSHKCLFGHHCQ